MSRIKIIDYGMGNLASIKSAISNIGGEADIVDHPDQLINVSHIILPGVGSFARAMNNLNARGWPSALNQILKTSNTHLLGICLGMHLLADQGSEHGNTLGLGLIPGQVISLKEKFTNNYDLHIPHVGWNEIHVRQDNDVILQGVENMTDMYFVHSYFFDAKEDANIITMTNYGFDFPSTVRKGRIWGAQFHPEKSGNMGLKILSNFIGCAQC